MASALKRLQQLEINWLYVLLIGAPLAIMGAPLGWPPVVIFALACIALIPLAGLIGESTEMLAERTGPQIGGLLNATLGNAAELIITIAAIREGLLELVKASITGSILGNLLLVLGASVLLGGLKNGKQTFNQVAAGQNANMLLMALIALAIPSLFSAAIGPDTSFQVEALSLGVAGCMILIYGLAILYVFRAAADDTSLIRPSAEHGDKAVWSTRKSVGVMLVAVVGVVWLSELLVGTVEPILHEFPFITEFFLGIVLIPIIGNVAEHLVAVQVAVKNQIALSMEIAVGSSLQIALFVAPALVFISLFFGPGHYLTLHFNQFELIAVMAASVIVTLVSLDGETNWLEGAQLLVVYLILALAFFFLPA